VGWGGRRVAGGSIVCDENDDKTQMARTLAAADANISRDGRRQRLRAKLDSTRRVKLTIACSAAAAAGCWLHGMPRSRHQSSSLPINRTTFFAG